MRHGLLAAALMGAAAAPLLAGAQAAPAGSASADELAKQLSNPVAALISVPLQLNDDEGFSPGGDGERWAFNVL